MKSNADTCHKLFKKTGLVTDIGNHNLKGKPLGFPYVSKGIYHVFHQYVIRTHERDRLREFLNQNGIGCGIYYPIHYTPSNPAIRDWVTRKDALKRLKGQPERSWLYPSIQS